jgi:WD40 repeat protein
VLALAVTGESRYIISGSRDKTIRVWDCESGKPVAVIRGNKNSVLGVATCPTKRLIATASMDGTVTVWEYT